MPEIRGQLDMFGGERTGNEDYEKFTAKFTDAPKTTDDCYTPANVYEAVADWVAEEYGVAREAMVRPFWPGGDYEAFDYPSGCAVVDNPPFSILVRIMRHYTHRGIPFFLFAPTLTLFSGRGLDVTYLPCGISITYANRASVNTSFITNMDTCRLRSVPALYRAIRRANEENERALTKELPKYSYPDHVLTAAAAYQYSHYGVDFRLEKRDCAFISAMDAQRAAGKVIFGGGLLLSERAAAERAAANVWALSEREWEMVRSLGEQYSEKRGGMLMGGMRVRATDAEMRRMRDAGMTNADIANSLGWISRAERMPTDADVDDWKCVLAWHVYQGPMLTGVHNFRENGHMTHWRPTPPPPEGLEKAAVNRGFER